jgi:hypothetical protein
VTFPLAGILALTIDGAQLVGLVLLGVVAGWLAADASRGPHKPIREESHE